MEPVDTTLSQFALQAAFQTMKERCQQLQTRLTTVEEENTFLRLHYEKNKALESIKINGTNEKNVIQRQQENIEELKKQKSQLAYHIFMVASENKKLWKRLTRLTQANKSLGNQLTKISDTLKQHPTTDIPVALTYSYKDIPGFKYIKNDKIVVSDEEKDKQHSLEEVSLRLINSIIIEKSELEEQYAEIAALQSNAEMNLKNIGFTYPEDITTDSLDQLKYHDARLTHIKEALLSQQNKLKLIVNNLKLKKNETCNNCKNSIEKLMCQTGTQFDSNSSSKDNNATQTSLPSSSTLPDKNLEISEQEKVCPLCGVVYNMSVSFDLFHEHVVNHFTKEMSDEFQIVE